MTEKAEREIRVQKVKNLMLNGYTFSEIMRKPVVKGWGIAKRTLEDYCMRARNEIVESNKISFEEDKATLTNRYWNAYRKAAKEKDWWLVKDILNALAKIKSLDKIQVTHFIKDKRDLSSKTDEELDQIIEGRETETP